MDSKKDQNSSKSLPAQNIVDKNQEENIELCPGFKDVDSFVKHGFSAVLSATKASAGLPQPGDEFDFYRSFPGFREFCESQGDKLLNCMSQIMVHHNCRSHMRDRNKISGLEERFDLVVDSNDVILEKVGILLDEADGINRSQQPVMPAGFQPPTIVVSSWNRKGSSPGSRSETFKLLHAKNIQRPQLRFKEKVDNSNTPFIPKIFVKPNAGKPLPSYFASKQSRREKPEDQGVPVALADFIHQQRTQEPVEDMFAHPYQYELDHLTTPENLLCKQEPQMYKSVDETSCSLINTLEDLVSLNEKLCKLPEFAVDLEHHSYRSFLGITCLMQISTREEDFIIDTLELRSEMYILNESFTDSSIVKVFHGADSDVEWLQRDLGLYVVNMFDTHQASRALNLARHSLDHLMKNYCSTDTDKRYQLADWRVRPLPEEMVQYARSDTHYLLYIYDCMRAQLLDFNHGQPALLQSVWNKSRDIALKKYVKPIFTEESHLELLRKQKRTFNTQQLAAFRLLFAWRDKLARQEDESTGYVLPTHMMSKVSEELPKEPQGIIACCNPVPPLVRQQVNELHLLVKEAREIPLLKAEVVVQKTKGLTPIKRPETFLFGPHDTSRVSTENLSFSADEMPVKQATLFADDEHKPEATVWSCLVAAAKISVFEEPEVQDDDDSFSVTQTKARRINESFENPFRMYLPPKDVHISKNAKFDPTSKIFEISKRWKLQTMEQQQQELESKQKAKEEAKLQAKKAAEERKKAKKTYQESLQNVPTVRQQAVESRDKEKKRERIPSEAGESTPKPIKKPKKTSEEPETTSQEEFKPFDYTQSDLKVFAGNKSSDDTHFDPYRQSHGFKNKRGSRGSRGSRGQRTGQASGNRSMSYLPGKSERGFRHNWPKR